MHHHLIHASFKLIHASLGPPESKSQMASGSVQPFLRSSPQSVLILYDGLPLPPSKLPLPMGDLDTHLTHGSLGPPESSSKQHHDQFSHFCTAHGLDRSTDHATQSVL